MKARSRSCRLPHGALICSLIACLLGTGWSAPGLAQQRSVPAQKAAPADTRKVPGETRKAAPEAARSLDGAWRLVKSLDPQTGQLRDIPAGIEMTKLVVGGRFTWVVTRNGQVLAGAGGTYSLSPTTYSETVGFAIGQNQQPLVGTTTRFTWKMEDGKWRHTGTIRVGANKQEIDEVWERAR